MQRVCAALHSECEQRLHPEGTLKTKKGKKQKTKKEVLYHSNICVEIRRVNPHYRSRRSTSKSKIDGPILVTQECKTILFATLYYLDSQG